MKHNKEQYEIGNGIESEERNGTRNKERNKEQNGSWSEIERKYIMGSETKVK